MERPPRRLPPLPLPVSSPNQRSNHRGALLVVLLIGLTSGLVGGTSALLNATTTNSGFVATPSLPGPTGPLIAAISNANISLTWTTGGLGTGNEYEVYRSNNSGSLAATPANCPTNTGGTGDQSYTPGTSIGFTNAAALTDSGTATMTSTSNGFLCYMLFGAYTAGSVPSAPVWLSHPVAAPFNPIANAHLPLLVTSVIFTDNAGPCTTFCSLDTGDTIQLTYNQPTTHPAIAGNTQVCVANATGVIYLGASYANPVCGGTGQLGSIAPPPAPCTCWAVNTPGKDPDYNATYTWNPGVGSGCPTTGTANNTVLCISVTTAKNTPLFTDLTSIWTLTPSTAANVQSNDAVAGNRVGVCATSAACTPTTTTKA